MSGFSFGSTTGTPGSGITFGNSSTTAATTTNSGFGFGAQTQTKPGGFAFPQTQMTGAAPGAGFGGLGTVTSTPAAAGGFGSSIPAAAGTTPAAGFSFGGTPAATTAAGGSTAAGAGFSFGTSTPAASSAPSAGFSLSGSTPAKVTSGFGLGQNTASPGLAKQTPTGFGLGVTPTAGTTPAGGLNLGGTPSSGTALGGLGTTPKATTVTGLLGGAGTTTAAGFSLGGAKPATTGLGLGTPSTGLGLSSTTTTQAGLTLGSATTTAATGLSLGAGTLTPAGGLTLGGTTASTSGGLKPTGIATPASSSGGLRLGATATAATTAATSSAFSLTTAASTTGTAAKPASMSYRQLEEQINKWSLELEEQEKVFLQQATQVNAWDRLLIDNADKITQLNNDVESVKVDQQRLDQELDFILSQQKELGDLLSPLEKAVEQLPPVNYQHHADLEREHTYQLSENIDAQLKRMVQDLKEIVEHVNANNTGGDNSDPVQQIGRILNAHMDSLHWVDQNSALLQRRVEEVARQAETRRKEQERNFRLAYD